MTEKKHEFQAEVAKLLHIVTHSLYSETEIFLRELVSNASDACDRLRYAALTDASLTEGDADFRVRLIIDKQAKTLTIEDNGIGMSEEDMVENLGTIARSGTSSFVDKLSGDAAKDVSVIGQFGVGFYSSFMVADKVEVISRRAGEDVAHKWVSDGAGSYTISEASKEARGTSILLHLKDIAQEFLEPNRIRNIIQTYADHIALPVILQASEEGQEDETLNTASALWTRPKSEITKEQYSEFYHHVGQAFDEPWMVLHSKVEGVLEYSLLLFIPEQQPFDLFSSDRKSALKLYVKRVFITDNCEELVPVYLRFLKGIVDSEDLPLNVSREMLQNNPVLRKIRSGLVKKVLSELEKKAKDDKEGFHKFWDNFGAVLKEGIYEDFENGTRLLELSAFHSTQSEAYTTLAEYVSRMGDDQESIYYITGDNLEAIRKSPQLEGFKAKGIEVLLLSDPVDNFWLSRQSEFEGKNFKSVTQGSAELDRFKGSDESDSEEEKADTPKMDLLIGAFRQALKDKVKDIRPSARLTDSPVCLVADDGDMDMHLEKMLKAHKQLGGAAAAQRILEINPKHALIKKLMDQAEKSGAADLLDEAALLLLDQAYIIEGEPLSDPVGFSQRMANFMAKSL